MAEENLKIGVLERQVLRCLFEHNDLLDKYEIDSFISPQANELYLDLISLKRDGKKIIPENIITLDK